MKFHIEPLRFVKKKVWWDLPSTNPCLEIVLPVSQQTVVFSPSPTSSGIEPLFERLYSRHSGLNRGELGLIMGSPSRGKSVWLRNL